jgi:hypothetical protein
MPTDSPRYLLCKQYQELAQFTLERHSSLVSAVEQKDQGIHLRSHMAKPLPNLQPIRVRRAILPLLFGRISKD